MDFNRSVVAVVVTYAQRLEFLIKTIDSLTKQRKITQIVVVQNGIDYDLPKAVKDYSTVSVIQNQENLGSAGGFWSGLNEALEQKFRNTNILILDDDNVLDVKALDELQKAEASQKFPDHIWALFRPNVQSKKGFSNPTERTYKSLNNTINGFTLEHLINKEKGTVPRRYADINCLATAPYSGLFFPQELLSTVGLPNRDFYLYSDDIDFTLRISKLDILILQCKSARCYDQSVAWQTLGKDNKKSRGAFFSTSEIYRPLYTYRNEVYISYHSLNTNSSLLFLNYCALQLWLFVAYMPKNRIGLTKFKLLKHAMADGRHGTLGKSKWIENTRTLK